MTEEQKRLQVTSFVVALIDNMECDTCPFIKECNNVIKDERKTICSSIREMIDICEEG